MNELETWLHKYINNTSITPDGEVYFIKRQVDKIRNMKIVWINTTAYKQKMLIIVLVYTYFSKNTINEN